MENLIKRVYAGAVLASGILEKTRFNTRVIVYHQVNPRYFEDQMRYLSSTYVVTSLNEALQNLKKQQVVITFDDGYTNNKAVAYSVLKKLGLKATVFVATEFAELDVFAWWDRLEFSRSMKSVRRLKKMTLQQIEDYVESKTKMGKFYAKPSKYSFLTWKELIEISDVFEIGSHTCSHGILTRMTPQEARREILDSKRILEKKTGMTVTSFAYTNGNYNDKIAAMVEEAGYKCAVAYKRGNNHSDAQKFHLSRRGIHYDDNVPVFAAKVAGFL